MCGIIGILGKRCVASSLLEGLKRLEYRGYDSSGVATVYNGHLYRVRAEGKLVHLEEKLKNASEGKFRDWTYPLGDTWCCC